ncbi:hypothetical protein ABW19_dt0204564 [Dactylella cylindrospora]|nr:hypothetical protein ABW19_dt0204564 [Dactylella cylindrospora]
MAPIAIEDSNPGLVLDINDEPFRSDGESTGMGTEPVTPVDPVIDSLAPQILVSQDGDNFLDASESVCRLSFSTEDSDAQFYNLPTPKHDSFRSRSAGHGCSEQGHGTMLRWMKSLRGKSKLPHIHYDVYRSQTPRDSIHGNLSIAPSAMTSATKLTASTNFVQRLSTATASRLSLSCYGSTAGFSKRDTVDQVDPLVDGVLEDTLDRATIERAQQRWKILAEIVLAEEAYIIDLKTMIAIEELGVWLRDVGQRTLCGM